MTALAKARALVFRFLSACLLIGLVGCAAKGTSEDSTGPAGPAVGVQQEGLTTSATITLTAPNALSPIAPVLMGLNLVNVGGGANVVSGPVVAMGNGGMPNIQPGALFNDVWSRGPVNFSDNVTVRGVLHAANVTLHSNDKCALTGTCVIGSSGRDATPRIDPVSTLSWTVTYPSGTGESFTLNQGQSRSINPGLYGSVFLNSQSTLTLGSGTYYFTDFVVNSSVSVNLNQSRGPVIIYVNNQLTLHGAFVPLGASDGGVVHPDLMVAYLGTNQTFVETLFDGALLAPFATLTIRNVSGIHTGFFAANNIDNLDASARVQYRAPAAVVAAAHPPSTTCAALLAGIVPSSQIPNYCGSAVCPDDTDHDGVRDCVDGCPYDPNKTAPGICGCNVPDIDSDGDGVPDCKERCNQDPNNVVPGQCGCVGRPGLEPAGTPCTDSACPQSGATCNGAGVCGNPAACSPCTGGRLIKSYDVSYWFCGMTFPPEKLPDGGTEVITTGAPTSEAMAQSSCSAKGLTLTRIDTPDENAFIARYLTAPLWLGANSLQTAGQWRWSLPNSNNGDLLWSGGPTGSRQNGLYSNWGPSAPGSATCSSMLPDGRWFDTGCTENLGWVCKYKSPPPGLPADAGVALPGPSDPVPMSATCVNEFDLDAGGLPDSLAALAAQVDAGRHGNFVGVAANPPPDGSTCPAESPDANPSEALGLGPDSGAGCWYTNAQQIFSPDEGPDGGPGLVDCITDQQCSQALGASFVCRTLKDVASCTPPDSGAPNLDAGYCVGHSRCVQLQCPRPADKCREVRLCKPNTVTDFDASPDPTTNFDAGGFNTASLFEGGLPDAAPSGSYSDPAMFDGAAHTWCHMDPQKPLPAATKPPANTNGSSGRGANISFAFDPNLVFNVNANPLALGENGMDLHAAATLSASVQLTGFLGQSYSADVIDIGAGLHGQRCSVNNDETQFTVLGLDVISLLGIGVPRFNSAVTWPDQTKACDNAVANFSLWANRVKKGFRDAQQLLFAYKTLKDNGKLLSSTLCHDIMALMDANDVKGFPGGLQCPAGEPVEMTINRFVDYLQMPAVGQIAQLRNAASDLVNRSTAVLDNLLPSLRYEFKDLQRNESQTILSVPFAIGPVPMLLQIDVFASYGITGHFTAELHAPLAQMAGLDDSATRTPGVDVPIKLARVEATVLPYAAAGLSAFVGAGTDLGAFSASVGIEGKVTLGQVSAPIYAGAGLDLLEQFDPRPIPDEIGGVSLADTVGNAFGIKSLFHFQKPKSFNLMVWFDYGAGIQLTNILSGEIDARLRIEFLFFSKTWRERIVKFNGWSRFFNLISGTLSASTTTRQDTQNSKHLPPPTGSTTVVTTAEKGGPSMGLQEQQLPLTVLQTLDVPDADPPPDATQVQFDASQVQKFFYDNQCCAHDQEVCKAAEAGAPQCCPDYNCVVPPGMDTGNCQKICVAAGDTCRPQAKVGCCPSLFCGPHNTCVSCVGIGDSCDATRPCCGTGVDCQSAKCCITTGNCVADTDCCSGTCNLLNDGTRACGIIVP